MFSFTLILYLLFAVGFLFLFHGLKDVTQYLFCSPGDLSSTQYLLSKKTFIGQYC